jgi:glycosyltransferase involved in cell wall biosynthesis
MNIIHDFQVFNSQVYGGVAKQMYEVPHRLNRIAGVNAKILAGSYVNKYILERDADWVIGKQRRFIPKTARLMYVPNYIFSKLFLATYPVDILHETWYSSQTVAPARAKIVTTVHDLIHEKFPNLVPIDATQLSKLKAKSVMRADRIVCVSNNTRKDLQEILKVPDNKLVTIYPGINPTVTYEQAIANTDRLVTEPYILYVGDRSSAYKNFDLVLQAYANSQVNRDFKLVCFGLSSFNDRELARMTELGIPISQTVAISGDDLCCAILYSQAALFIYPSLYEGFGLPPLEAMFYRCPVICSNTSSIPEVVGDAAYLFDPNSVDEIVTSMESLLYSSTIRANLIAKGLQRYLEFSWDKCAQNHFDRVYSQF